jgi:hypothetical protein
VLRPAHKPALVSAQIKPGHRLDVGIEAVAIGPWFHKIQVLRMHRERTLTSARHSGLAAVVCAQLLVASIEPLEQQPWRMFPLSDGCCPQPACEDPHHAKPEVGHFLNQRQKAIFIDRKYCKVSSCDSIGGSRTVVDDGHFAKNVAVGQPLQQLCASPDLDRAGLYDIENAALLAAMKNDLSSFESKVFPAVAGKDTEIEVGLCHAQFSSDALAWGGRIVWWFCQAGHGPASSRVRSARIWPARVIANLAKHGACMAEFDRLFARVDGRHLFAQ